MNGRACWSILFESLMVTVSYSTMVNRSFSRTGASSGWVGGTQIKISTRILRRPMRLFAFPQMVICWRCVERCQFDIGAISKSRLLGISPLRKYRTAGKAKEYELEYEVLMGKTLKIK